MESASMMIGHQAATPWEWSLARATATRLRAAPRPRWLLVTAGRVWLTQSGRGSESEDVWLGTGERLLLPAGSDWVAEGWPEARVELLEAPAL
ncbi:MAG: DUF2917 domain-containing protein, partial [Burkholderiales bacterium]|nr:DUF2917 domain-containing protein [Burkholderiales bacterium]